MVLMSPLYTIFQTVHAETKYSIDTIRILAYILRRFTTVAAILDFGGL